MKLQIKYYDVVESTNLTAIDAAKCGAKEGTVIVAKKQNSGRGRMCRVWTSPPGGLWFSIILRPPVDPAYAAQLTLLAGTAVCNAVRRLYHTEKAVIKWPNDLLFNGKKICGILSELQLNEKGSVEYAVIGIGLNIDLNIKDFPPELRNTATSLNYTSGEKHTCEEALNAVLDDFFRIYELWVEKGADVIIPIWKSLNCTLGNWVEVRDNDETIFQGTALDIDGQGALMVCDDNGLKKVFDFGEISIR